MYTYILARGSRIDACTPPPPFHRVVAERGSNEICYLHSLWASVAAVRTCGSFSWRWSCSPDSLSERSSEPREWKRPMGRLRALWLQQVDRHFKEMGMDQASAWGMARRRPLEYFGKWTQWRIAPVHSPILDLTWPVDHEKNNHSRHRDIEGWMHCLERHKLCLS